MQEGLQRAFREFLATQSDSYGYSGRIGEVKNDFSRLQGAVYLDHAGAVPYSDSLLRDVFEDLKVSVLTNPHSSMGASDTRADVYEEARLLTLNLCQAQRNEYDVIFTSGATQALKLVGEAFPWSPSSLFAYTRDNHNSVLGIRHLALEAGAIVLAVDVEQHSKGGWCFPPCGPTLHHTQEQCRKVPTAGQCLFALPQESNFNGECYDAGIIDQVQIGGLVTSMESQVPGLGSQKWFVLLDAAKACATMPPNLTKHPADFVALSFYKIFGYPTGLGALVARKCALKVLKHGYFGGGTLEAVAAESTFVKRRPGGAAWEHGTPNFIAIASLKHGFKRLASLGGFPAIHLHTTSLATWLSQKLVELKHANNKPVCRLYGASKPKMGPIVAFNLLHDDGSWVGYREVERLARLNNIYIRTGCFCNPGACSKALGLTFQSIIGNYEAGHICGDDFDLVDGVPTGVVRVSIGYSTSFEEVYRFLTFITTYFVHSEAEIGAAGPCQNECTKHFVDRAPNTAEAQQSEGVAPFVEWRPTPTLLQAATELAGDGCPRQRLNARGDGCPSSPEEASIVNSPSIEALRQAAHAQSGANGESTSAVRPCSRGRLEQLFLYPVKSCGAQQVQSWPVGPGGLLFDRHWALVDGRGRLMTLRSHARMVLIRPQVDLTARTLTLRSREQGVPPICVSIDEELPATTTRRGEHLHDSSRCETEASSSTSAEERRAGPLCIRLCGKSVLCNEQWGVSVEHEELRSWLRRALSVDCTLVRLHQPEAEQAVEQADHTRSADGLYPACAHGAEAAAESVDNGSAAAVPEAHGGRGRRRSPGGRSGFANEDGMLLVSTASLDDLSSRLSTGAAGADPLRFRANLIVRAPSGSPFEEDGWRGFAIGSCRFVVRKRCSRCDVIRVDHDSGTKGSAEPLLALARYRRSRGNINFGVICDAAPRAGVAWLKAGDDLMVEEEN